MASFEIDPDIRKAKTLSSEFYTDERYFELSKEKIFAKSWQLVATADEISSLKPFVILPDFLDEPILISRNEGVTKCLSNVCTHRGKILVETECEADLIRCGYHGRRFSLDGKFLSMPEFEGVEDFPCESDNLTIISSANWGKFLFVSMDSSSSFANFISDAASAIEIENYADAKLISVRDYEVNAHWALYCENYLEGFHIPFVHRSLNEVVDYGSYKTETFRFSSLQTALSESPVVAGGLTRSSDTRDAEIAARYLFIFPNLMFNFYPWGISVNIVRPVSPSKSVVEFLTYVRDESLIEIGAGADLHGVELEDEAVVESVQKGIRSRFYSHGRYSPTREQGTHHFHRLIAEFLG